MARVSKRVTYSGRVQGVGFRYTARQLASGFPITGFVRNHSNGDVELVAEGEPAAVEAFLAAVAKRMHGYITGTEVRDQEPAGYAGFEIRP
jgi:acylphosphatase